MTRAEARQKRRERASAGVDTSWQKWVRCKWCSKLYCCNNYPDRRPRTKRLLGRPCCAQCYYLVRPVLQKMAQEGLVKFYRKKSSE